MSTKYTKLRGFRDFLPQEKALRNYVEAELTKVFESFNFKGIETPTIEYQELLLGKYGMEADKLVYKFEDNGQRKVALRYDQTVPTARFIVENQNQLPKYFRRYQIQNVFRSEKPQAGRYRELKQCDIDIYGTKSPIADAEILACVYKGYEALGIKNIQILINDRQLLVDTITKNNDSDVDVFSIIQTIDKQDKVSPNEILTELVSKGMQKENAMKVWASLEQLIGNIPENLQNIINLSFNLGVPKESVIFQPYLARGLDYYTGMILEVKSDSFKEGSLGGGGRYDNLINDLVKKDVPAVGFAFGLDRIVELIKQDENRKILKNDDYLVCVFNDESLDYSLQIANKLRRKNNVEVYPNLNDTLQEQLKYALVNKFKYIVIAGQKEMEKGIYIVKNLETRLQEEIGF